MATTASQATVAEDIAAVDEPEQSNGRGRLRVSWRSFQSRRRLSASRIPQLDLLRAAAILLVIGRHLELSNPGGPVGVVAEAWYRLGWIGVDLFFVLSGFLIAGLLINETKSQGSLDIRRFLVRRGLKIYPLYFLFLGYLIFAPVVRVVVSGGAPGQEFTEQLSAHWPHLVFVQNYVDSGTAGHLWSIAVEEHFYILLPLLIAALGFRRMKSLIWIGVAGVFFFLALRLLSVATDDPFSQYMSATHLRLDGLLFGVALWAALEYYPIQFAKLRRWRLPLFAFGLACWAPNLFLSDGIWWTGTFGLTLTLLGAAAFLVAIYTSSGDDLGPTQPVGRPVVGVLCWVGVFSYAIYLWHVTAMGGLTKVTDRTIGAWFGDGQVGWLLSTTVIVAGVLAVGILATLAIERPVLRLRDRMAPSRAGSMPTEGDPSSVAAATPAPTMPAPRA